MASWAAPCHRLVRRVDDAGPDRRRGGAAVTLARLKRAPATLALLLLILVAAPAAADAEPAPFGHACVPQAGVRVCRALSDAQRVPSWDGVPLAVDVTLPATGDGPFPTLVVLREPASVGAETLRYARRGYAVVDYSARGFGRSCGDAESRTPDCARGWTHLADQRYEARDVQHLLGALVDQAIARPDALGVAGEAGGGGVALELAFLRNRVRQPDGSFVPWRSPAGLRLTITAAFAMRPGHDLLAALLPNGRFLDSASAKVESLAPLGVARIGAVDSLLEPEGFIAPRGQDPGADLRGWKTIVDGGEPYGAAARRMAGELTRYHSAARLTGTPAPVLVQARWDDDVFGPGRGPAPLQRAPRAQPTGTGHPPVRPGGGGTGGRRAEEPVPRRLAAATRHAAQARERSRLGAGVPGHAALQRGVVDRAAPRRRALRLGARANRHVGRRELRAGGRALRITPGRGADARDGGASAVVRPRLHPARPAHGDPATEGERRGRAARLAPVGR